MVKSFSVQGCNHMYVSYIPFEVPYKSADNRSFKIGMHFEVREKIITA